jgi:hypothetical protein
MFVKGNLQSLNGLPNKESKQSGDFGGVAQICDFSKKSQILSFFKYSNRRSPLVPILTVARRMGKERSLVPIALSSGMGWARSALPILGTAIFLSKSCPDYCIVNVQ